MTVVLALEQDEHSVEDLDMMLPEDLCTYNGPIDAENMNRLFEDVMDADEEQFVAQGPGVPMMSSKGSMPTWEAQVGPLFGVPRSSNRRGSRPDYGQKRAKVVTLHPSPARSPGKYPKSVTLRKTLLSCLFSLVNEFFEL